MEMGQSGNVTPQVLEKIDSEYQKITKKYASMAHKS